MSDKILQPHELAERGLWTAPAPTTNPLSTEGIEMLRANYTPGTYTAEEDVTETLPDGRTIQIAVKGHPIPMSEAIKAGLVKPNKAQGPTERKPAQGPQEVKAQTADADGDADADADNVDAADTNPPPAPAPAPTPTPTPKAAKK